IFINLMEMMNRTTISMELVNDGNDDCPMGDDESHENDSVIMLCYDWATGSINSSYNNQYDCVTAGSTFQWIDMEYAIMDMMFNMYDNNSNGFINASELGMMMDMGDDDHDDHHDGHGDHSDHWEPGTCHDNSTHETHEEYTDEEECEAAGHLWMGDEHHGEEHGVRGFANLHVEAEGEYGFLLPAGVALHVLSGDEGHSDHGDHGDHDDHGDEDGDHDDHGDEDGDHDDHDDHAEEEIPFDPHSWLDPIAFKAQIDVVLTALIAEFPSAEEDFTANANAYKLELDKIALGFENAFGESGTCATDKTFAANHNAYSYLAQRYDLEFVTIHGLDPEGEPSAEDIAEVVAKIQEEEITVFYVEEYTDISSVNSIVSETGVTILYLYTMEMPPSTPGEDYLSLMQKNLDNLVSGIGC
ncbi:MAG: zinc ABC transporter substrate-binding protein, partial [Candidatus Thermoplasmatota archaeon]|nr:zinc ABC transporter substrate-binding protein [Candidatus Thermoplasmatota archaeon]